MFDTRISAQLRDVARDERHVTIDGLDQVEPGPFLAVVLAGLDLGELSGEDRVTVLKAYQRLTSHYQAQTYEAMTSIVDAYETEEGWGYESACEGAAYELRPALRLTRRAADRELSFALELRDRLPRVFEALSQGVIDQRRARTIVWQTTHLNDDEARIVVERIIDKAPELTTGQLMARIRKLCMQIDTEAAQKRYDHAITERRVVMEPTVDGTATITAQNLPPDQATAATRRINQIAKSLRRDGETRTMDQLRADVVVDLLLGKDNSGEGSAIDLRVDLNTLLDLNDNPGDLAGYGPVISDIARKVTAGNHDAQWRYTITDQGHPIATGTTRRRPTTAQQRLVEATYRTCIFPGCRMPASQCDIDHRTDWAITGETNTDDLAPGCRHDHNGAKHTYGWEYRIQQPGIIEWTSPLGHTYQVKARAP